ncbi:hypothetical protein SAMN02982929_07228 [Saccharopolyspora kobensis]|uniref:Uncharacterized protein n=1 Tax=Saccharopolyspora kobensis TaxID=146035 RepID=A0A1H6EP95_9PSEU|nr:hypothetical protein SAMN02982929_07228 [Saccharopolyspora kobensis]SFD23015.1 hypothetical protein SAMN05216506_103150 [Saccharopolyspora kobensis]
MALVLGPNGVVTYVPDDIARSLIGDGGRGYTYAPEPQADETEEAPPLAKKTPARRPRSKSA